MVRKSSSPSLAFPLVCLSLCHLVDWLVAPLTLTQHSVSDPSSPWSPAKYALSPR